MYRKEMPQPTPKDQCRTHLPQLPKGRPKPPTNKCSGRHQPICALGTTINGLPEKCTDETHQTTAKAARLSQLPVQ